MSDGETLTLEDYEILEMPFAEKDLGGKGKEVYIYRSAIMDRLKLVDPDYQEYIDPRTEVENDTVTVWGSLTLNGVTRWNSASVVIQCWRKEQDGSYVRFGDYEYAKALANAKMSAATGLLQRCAAKFGVGIELKERAAKAAQAARRGQRPPPAGQPPSNVTRLGQQPPSDTPKHWAHNGGGERIKAKMKTLNLTSAEVLQSLEPGKTLARLSETSLAEEQVSARLDEIALAKLPGSKSESPAADTNGAPMKVRGSELHVDDMVDIRGDSRPYRVMEILGDTDDNVFVEIIVWQKTQFMTIKRLPFEKDMMFNIRRGAKLTEIPDTALRQINDLKTIYEASKRKPQDATT